VTVLFTGSVIVTTTHLEQDDPADLRAAREPAEPALIGRVGELAPEFSRFLYTAVGGDWYWLDRRGWNLAEWVAWLSRPGSETWVAWFHGAPAGYVELAADIHDGATHVEIAYFGLLARFTGRGLGGQLLTQGLSKAWTLHERWPVLPEVSRVWVHTCTLDGPYALRNYLARGFRIHHTTQAEQDVPDDPPGPWPDSANT
jgi:GNAT superfamily N-acetyltransferase